MLRSLVMFSFLFFIFFSTLQVFAANTATSYTNIIFSEIAYDTTGIGGNNELNKKEWIELFNPTNQDIDISGWEISDSDNQHYIFPSPTIISSGESFLLVNDTSSFQLDYPGIQPDIDLDGAGCYQQDRCIALENGSDSLTLEDNTGTLIDTIFWEGVYEANEGTSLCRTNTGWESNCDTTAGSMNIGLSVEESSPPISPVPTTIPAASNDTNTEAITIAPSFELTSLYGQKTNASGGSNPLIVEKLEQGDFFVDHQPIGKQLKDTQDSIANTNSNRCSKNQYYRYPEKRSSEFSLDFYTDQEAASSHKYYDALIDLTQQEILSGEGKTKNASLDQYISRAEATKIATIAREDIIPCSLGETFYDILRNEWFFPFVWNLDELSIVHGRTETMYHPEEPINWAETYKILALSFEIEQYSETKGEEFWYTKYMYALNEHGLIEPWVTHKSADDYLTRGEFFSLVSYALKQIDRVE